MPPSFTGSSTANGVAAPVRPTLTSMSCSDRRRLLAGNLNAIAQRGNFEVAPRRSRSARSSTLMTTPSVSNSSVVPLVLPVVAEREQRLDAVAALPVRLDRQPPPAQQRRASPEWRWRSRAIRGRPADRRTRRRPRSATCARIEVAHRPGGGVAGIGERRLVVVLALAVDALELAARQIDLAANLDAARPGRRAARSGCARIVRTLDVTSSPRTPSPRVTPRTSRPSS